MRYSVADVITNQFCCLNINKNGTKQVQISSGDNSALLVGVRSLRLRQHRLQIMPGVRRRNFDDILRRPLRHNLPALDATLRP